MTFFGAYFRFGYIKVQRAPKVYKIGSRRVKASIGVTKGEIHHPPFKKIREGCVIISSSKSNIQERTK